MTGRGWLSNFRQVELQTLNLSGCSAIDPDVLSAYLGECRSSLRHLNLHGCVRAGHSVVQAIARRHKNLVTLVLGGCSQTIRDSILVTELFPALKILKHLDLEALNHISDSYGLFMNALPASLESLNLSSCKKLRLRGLVATGAVQTYINNIDNTAEAWRNAPTSKHKLQHVILDAIGSPRLGLCPGILTYFALGRSLREVHLAGCENVHDWEIEALAISCSKTLTCFQMRASCIGSPALMALAKHCEVLAECDVSACFGIGDEGILALCESRRVFRVEGNKKRGMQSCLKALHVASIPNLTDLAVAAMANLESLLVLDIHDCPKITAAALCKMVLRLPHAIDVNAKGVAGESISLSTLLRGHANTPPGLRFVNQRVFRKVNLSTLRNSCCSVRLHSQRLNSSVPMQIMIHCVDCNLLPKFDRGICSCCASTCHEGHKTFVGSWTRFYCDCPFSATENQCQAIFPAESRGRS